MTWMLHPMLHSPHSIRLFQQCRRRYFHERVAHDVSPLPETPESEWGREAHRLLEARIQAGVEVTEKKLRKTSAWLEETLAETDGGEVRTELKLAVDRDLQPCGYEQGWIRGIADFVATTGRQGLVVDWKTGKRPRKPDWTQLNFYAAVVLRTLPMLERVRCIYHWTKTGRTDELFVEREDVPLLMCAFRNWALEAERERVWKPFANPLCEKWCPVLSCEFNGLGKSPTSSGEPKQEDD